MKRIILAVSIAGAIALSGCSFFGWKDGQPPYGYNGWVTQQDADACREGDPISCYNYQKRDTPQTPTVVKVCRNVWGC